ncbi:hypothetical protein [Laspinema olomoucense]|uniref:Uncharacterized protein n=1 Tax=Laspinema olomoucense D3b TaxID=2953688 RepID=A0ABT2N9T8_9CYAN|nr:hypothetical protein [Laspinema sp. D3b]MCT7979464.1 hypothetical protein [Laspinema sp. D3b]
MLEENNRQKQELKVRSQEISHSYNKASNLQSKNEDLKNKIRKLTQDNSTKQNILNQINQNLAIANRERYDQDGQISTLRKQVEILLAQSQYKGQEIDKISGDVETLRKERSQLLQELNRFEKENKILQNEVELFQKELNNLLEPQGEENEQLYEFDPLNDDDSILPTVQRELTGRYLGNISKTTNRYHWSPTCGYYKSLAFEYLVMREDKKRTILNTDDKTEFNKYNLGPCNFCLKPKKYK